MGFIILAEVYEGVEVFVSHATTLPISQLLPFVRSSAPRSNSGYTLVDECVFRGGNCHLRSLTSIQHRSLNLTALLLVLDKVRSFQEPRLSWTPSGCGTHTVMLLRPRSFHTTSKSTEIELIQCLRCWWVVNVQIPPESFL